MTAAPSGADVRLRIVHVRNADRVSGPERLLLDQMRHAAPDIEARLAVFQHRGTDNVFVQAARAQGLQAHAVAQRSSYDPRLGRRLREHLRDVGAQLVVTHDYKANHLGGKAARRLGLPWVAVVHGYTAEDPKVRLFEAMDRRALRGADAVVVVAEALERRLLRADVPRARLVRIDNGVDVKAVAAAAAAGGAAARRDLGADDTTAVVLSLGRLSPEKGHDVLVEAFARVAREHPAARLVLVGDGVEEERLAARARERGIADRVRFAGWRGDAAACLGAADVFVLPSRTEGLPLALLEAMAAGIPAVVTDVGAMAEVLDHGAAGLVVPADDVAALAAALAAALDDPKACAARAAQARMRVQERYDTSLQARALEKIYRRVVG